LNLRSGTVYGDCGPGFKAILILTDVSDFHENTVCAAGTGSFWTNRQPGLISSVAELGRGRPAGERPSGSPAVARSSPNQTWSISNRWGIRSIISWRVCRHCPEFPTTGKGKNYAALHFRVEWRHAGMRLAFPTCWPGAGSPENYDVMGRSASPAGREEIRNAKTSFTGFRLLHETGPDLQLDCDVAPTSARWWSCAKPPRTGSDGDKCAKEQCHIGSVPMNPGLKPMKSAFTFSRVSPAGLDVIFIGINSRPAQRRDWPPFAAIPTGLETACGSKTHACPLKSRAGLSLPNSTWVLRTL